MVEFSMYSIGSGAFLREVFNGVAMITGTGDFTKAVMIGMLFSVILVCFQAILRGGREIAWQNILVGWILYGMFFAVPARVIVEDVYNGQVYTVDNVPLGSAAAGSMISRVGYGLTRLLETGYGTADRVTELPYLNTLYLMLWAQQGAKSSFFFDKLDKKTGLNSRATLNEYLRNCVVPEINVSGTPNGLNPREEKVRDILTMGKDDNNNYSAIYKKSATGRTVEAVKCSTAYNEIVSRIVPNLDNATSAMLFDDQLHDWNTPGSDNYDLIEKQSVAQVFDRLNLTTQDRQDYMLASVIRPIFDDAFRQWHTRSQTAADLMVAQALMQRNTQWTAEQSIWATVVHPLMAFFEGFVYAITPFVALLLFTGSMGLGLIGKYLQVLFWINLWMPLMSICNLYITMSVDGALQTMNLSTMNGVAEVVPMLQHQIATGGMLMTATPMLALFIVTGSTYAFTTLTSRLNGGDHINEKIVTPDVASVGTVFEQQAYAQGNRGSSYAETGSQANFKNLNVGGSVSKAFSSIKSWAKGKAETWQNTFSKEKGITTDITKDKHFGKNLQEEERQQASETTGVVKQIMTDLSHREDQGWGEDGSIGIKAMGNGFAVTVKGGETYTLTKDEKASLDNALSLAKSKALAKTAVSMSSKGEGNGWHWRRFSGYQHAAQDFLNSQKQFSEAESAMQNMGGQHNIASNTMGVTISKLRGDGAMEAALGNAYNTLNNDDKQWIAGRENQLERLTGNKTVAHYAALMERLDGKATYDAKYAAAEAGVFTASGMAGFNSNPFSLGGLAGINPDRSHVESVDMSGAPKISSNPPSTTLGETGADLGKVYEQQGKGVANKYPRSDPKAPPKNPEPQTSGTGPEPGVGPDGRPTGS